MALLDINALDYRQPSDDVGNHYIHPGACRPIQNTNRKALDLEWDQGDPFWSQ